MPISALTDFDPPPSPGSMGTSGNDTLHGGAGTETIDGLGGIDTIIFSGNRAGYTLSHNTDGSYAVTDNTGAGGTDTLLNIERIQFADKKLAFDLDGGAGATAKLIAAAFGMSSLTPDLVSQGISLFDAGYTLDTLSQPVINTGLFQGMAGSSSNTAFVTLVYHNVMGTTNASEAGDIAYFVSLLDQHVLTQAELLVKAANCAENIQHVNLVGLAATGLEYT